jgi:hypothetical protein
MKKIFLLIWLLFAIQILNNFFLHAQNTEGKEFWLTFGKQRYALPTQVSALDMQIRIVGGKDATKVTISFTHLGTPPIVYNMSAYEVYDCYLDNTQKAAMYNTEIGITNYSAHITTTEPVSVYAFIQLTSYSEVTNVLPVTALGTAYYQISYTPSVSALQDAYAVVATQNNTQLFNSGNPLVTLQAGQVYYQTSTTDMTGTLITSNQPVAFFATHQGATIPNVGVSSSHLMQQLAPVNTWDKTFFLLVTINENDFVRIVASKNGTDITQLVGGTIRTGVPGAKTYLTGLQAGDFVELDITTNGCFIEANQPIGVCSYIIIKYYYDGFIPTLPAQCWIPGVGQTVSNAKMAPFVPENLFQYQVKVHYALICTPTDTKGNTKVSIGGAAPSALYGGDWYDNASAGMSFYSMPLPDTYTSYIFFNSEGVIVFGYGVGYANLPASYYYLAYSAMRDLDAAFYANDIHFQDLKDNPFCEDNVDFLAEIEGLHPTHPERLTWWIDGVEYLPAKNLDNWSNHFSVGEYEIEMKVRYENDDTISKTGTLIINSCNQSADFYMNDVHHLTDTTFCNKNVNFRAEIDGLHPTAPDKIIWYVDGVEETTALNLTEWGKPFENGTYEIKMVVQYDNDDYATLIGTLKIQALWIKMRNIRY